jgi:hypothetical protein
MIEILLDKLVKIRKPRRCFACQRSFEIGSEMRRQVNKFDGDLGTVYSCNTCDTLMKNHKAEFIDESEGVFPECCVRERFHEYKVKNPEELLECLTPVSCSRKNNVS